MNCEINFSNINIQRLNLDFNGVLYLNNSIFAYGTGGTIIYSKDNGNFWETKKILNDTLTINKLINLNNNKIIGIADFDFLVFSSNSGASWSNKRIGNNETLFSISYDSTCYYVLKQNKIEQYNFDLDLIKTISIDKSINATELIVLKNNLYLNDKNGNVLTINLNSFEANIIDFFKIGINPDSNATKYLRKDNDRIYVSFGSKVYFSSDNGDSWTKGANIANIYNVINNEIFYPSAENCDSNRVVLGLVTYFKCDSTSSIKISKNIYDRRVSYLFFTDLEFKNTDTIIAVGKSNLIAISYNKGVNWEIISQFKLDPFNKPKVISKNKILFQNNLDFIVSNNVGSTWLPMKYSENSLNQIQYFDMNFTDSSGKCFAFSTSGAKNIPNSLITNDFFNTYKIKQIPEFANYIPANYYLATNLKIDSLFITFFPSLNFNNYQARSFVVHTDVELNVKKQITIDSFQLLNGVVKDGIVYALARTFDRRDPGLIYVNSKINLLKSTNLGESWVNLLSYPNGDTMPTNYLLFNDKLYFGNQFDYFDSSKKEIISTRYLSRISLKNPKLEIVSRDKNSFFNMIELESKLFLQGFGNFLYLENDDDPSFNWKQISNTNDSIFILSKVDNTYIIKYLDKKKHKENYGLMTLDITTIVDELHFSIQNNLIYPNPAKDYIEISLDSPSIKRGQGGVSSYDVILSEARNLIKIYNSLGIEFTPPQTPPLEGRGFKIDISYLPTGVYFIKIGDKFEKFVKL